MGQRTSSGKNKVQKNKRFSIHWFDPEPTVGAEMRKPRPCIIVSPEEINRVTRTVLVVPLTSKIKSWPFRLGIKVMGNKSSAACDQLRVVDKSRLREYIEDLSPAESDNILGLLQTIFLK